MFAMALAGVPLSFFPDGLSGKKCRVLFVCIIHDCWYIYMTCRLGMSVTMQPHVWYMYHSFSFHLYITSPQVEKHCWRNSRNFEMTFRSLWNSGKKYKWNIVSITYDIYYSC